MPNYPKITFGIIVLNGEPFTRYCLRSIYPFAHEIIVVEGGHEDARSVCTADGHSIDNTLESLFKFKQDEDVENKLTIITRNGFWPKKDEWGRDRTPQSRAYAERATGDYLWQIDIDEFYRTEDMIQIIKMLQKDTKITAVTFPTFTFWGDIKYIADSWALRRGAKYYHRLFKWSPKYKYITHEPPTVIDEKGIDLRQKKWITGKKMERRNIYMFHYSLLFPWQVEQKVKVYRDEKPDSCSEIIQWAEHNYFKINNPFRVHNIYRLPGWLKRYHGKHPDQIQAMMRDIKQGRIKATLRPNEDVETLLNSKSYNIKKYFLKSIEPIDCLYHKSVFNISRIKNIPRRIKKLYNKL
ncbi:MAG TPA: glycosyltransferase family A protein [Chitinophagaceae bacterium]|nr:glycosyltransferase family A protein [Chitinophagaceae bacterium]